MSAIKLIDPKSTVANTISITTTTTSKRCSGCRKPHTAKTSRCDKCLETKRKKTIRSSNILWNAYPELKDRCLTWEKYPKTTIGSKTKIEWICPSGHTFKSSPENLLLYPWCGYDRCEKEDKLTERGTYSTHDSYGNYSSKCNETMIKLDKTSIELKVKELIETTSSFYDFDIAMKNVFKNSGNRGLAQEIFAKFYFISHASHYNIRLYYARYENKKLPKSLEGKVNVKDWGSDAVILHNDDSISLVQVKFRYDRNYCLKRESISGMSLESKGLGGKLYLFSNTVSEPKNFTPKDKSYIKTIMYMELLRVKWELIQKCVYLDNLDKASLDNLDNLDKSLFRIDTPPLRDWQINACKFIEEIKMENDGIRFYRATVVAACGAGKTLFANTILSGYKKRLIIVPNLHLLNQWFECIAAWNPELTFCLVGSDLNTSKTSKTSIIQNTPFNLTTDPETISSMLSPSQSQSQSQSQPPIVITTFQSLKQVLDACSTISYKFDLSIVDEAHMCCTTNKDSIYSLPTKLDFPAENVLFMTATPKIFTGQRKEICTSMDDERVFGKQFTYSFKEAIDDGIISDYKITVGIANANTIDIGNVKLDLKFYARLLSRSIKKNNIHSLLVCAPSHAKSKDFYNIVKSQEDIGDYKLYLLPPRANSKHKAEAVHLVQSGQKVIIFQVRVFSLGSDLPSLDSVMFLGDRKSVIDIVQTASRCMRKSKSSPEKIAHILIPCIIQDTEDIESLGTFPNVRNIIAAMGSVDQALIDTVVLKSRKTDIGVGSGGIGSSRISRAIEFDSVDFVDDRMKLDDASFELKIFDRICEKSNGIHWFKRLIQVSEFWEREGRLPRSNEGPLGRWCDTQRQNKKKGKLSPDQIKSFEERILGWYWEQDLDGEWEDKRQAAIEFLEKEGRLPRKSEGPLGRWCSTQRVNKKKGKLSSYRIKSLEEIPGWYWGQDLDERWEDKRQAVSEFVEKKGRLPRKNEGPLGRWCGEQRYNEKKGKLSSYRIKSLEEIPGWYWSK